MTLYALPSPYEIKTILKTPARIQEQIASARQIATDIISGKDPRIALVIGPCSIHEKKSAIEYAKRLKALSERVKNSFFIVMRTYVEKSRTSSGWKGWVYDPHLDGSNDLKTGLLWTRELLLAISEIGVPCATEFVDPLASQYFEDLISWGFIGARTAESQPHRTFASSLCMPIGFKNSTDGNVNTAIHGVLSAALSHTCMQIDSYGRICALETSGNPHSHIVLRGGEKTTNYDIASVLAASKKLREKGLNPRLMIDCSHGNSQKKFDKQGDIFFSILKQIERGGTDIIGTMLESHLEEGSQPHIEHPAALKYAVSITDPCVSWKTTEEWITAAYHGLNINALRAQ